VHKRKKDFYRSLHCHTGWISQAKNTKIIGGIAIKKKEAPDNSKGENRQDSGKLCFPPVEYDRRTEKERQQFNGEIIETLYPFLKEFMTFH